MMAAGLTEAVTVKLSKEGLLPRRSCETAPSRARTGRLFRLLLRQAVAFFDRQIQLCGRPDGVTGSLILGAFAAVIFWGTVIGLGALLTGFMGRWGLLCFVCLIGAVPAVPLINNLSSRVRKIRLALPQVLDLLSVTIQAGMDFTSGLEYVLSGERPGPLKSELQLLLSDIRMGKSRRRALEHFAERVAIPEIQPVAKGLIQADESGSDLVPVLQSQAEILRQRRFQAAEKKAHEASTKLVIPMALFIMPTIFIGIFGPVVLNLWRMWQNRPF